MLTIADLSVGYGRRRVLWDVGLSVGEGETVAVLGANTAGKTTLIRAVAGLLPVATGSIRLGGEEILRVPAHRRVARGVALVPEGRHVFPRMTVEENLRLGAYHRRRDDIAGDIEACFALFPRLRERRRQSASSMSGGEQQMVAIGRALMAKPRRLMLDEPGHGLAPLMVEEVHAAIRRINAAGVSVLLVEQNVAGALALVGRAYVIENGRIALSGTAAELSRRDEVRGELLGDLGPSPPAPAPASRRRASSSGQLSPADRDPPQEAIMARFTAAVVQAGTEGADAEATLAKAEALIAECGHRGAGVAVFPEASIGGYLKGADFQTCIGLRRPGARDEFVAYASRAITVPGPETDRLGRAAAEAKLFLVIGVVERDGGTLYCTAVFFGPDGTLLGRHRKTLPTAGERLVWGKGDGSTLTAVPTPWGPMGAVICWENYVPPLRMAMYAKGLSLWCAPTADDRDTWASTVRHVAFEGRCFVLSACQYLKRGQFPDDIRNTITDAPDDILMRGGSMIAGPMGAVLAGPDFESETILTAELDTDDVVRGQYDLDLNGHYSRPDLFALAVDERPQPAVTTNRTVAP